MHGFVVSDVVTDNKHSGGEGGDNGYEMKKEAVGEYLAAVTAACDRVSRLEPSSSTGHGEMDSVHVHPRMAFMALIKKIVAAGAAGVGEGEDWEEIGDDGGMEREYEYDSSVKNLLAVCAAGAK